MGSRRSGKPDYWLYKPVLTPQAFSVPEPGIWTGTQLAPAPVIVWKMGGEVEFFSARRGFLAELSPVTALPH